VNSRFASTDDVMVGIAPDASAFPVAVRDALPWNAPWSTASPTTAELKLPIVASLATAGETGLKADADGCVLDASGAPIPGVYACGNDMASLMCGTYSGPGITLGPALLFGFRAAGGGR
jgi:predicted oxidoreductase